MPAFAGKFFKQKKLMHFIVIYQCKAMARWPYQGIKLSKAVSQSRSGRQSA